MHLCNYLNYHVHIDIHVNTTYNHNQRPNTMPTHATKMTPKLC